MAKIVPDFDLCTGCGICMLACSEQNFGGYNPRYAVMNIITMQDEIFEEPIMCNQCTNAACMRVCPVEAINTKTINLVTKDETIQTTVVSIDKEKCTGCGLCKEYCPRGVIVINENKAHKCELCHESPQCVKTCPKNALKIYPDPIPAGNLEGVEKNA